jgi:3-oxoacyl-[acyl-carrier protein] reductase
MKDALCLDGRIALVTGGGRGIGRAVCLSLAEAGAAVAVNYRRDDDAANDVVDTVRAAGGTAAAFSATIGDEQAMRGMVDTVGSQLGQIDILVNNAGIASRGQSVLDTDPGELHRLMTVNAFSPHLLAQLVLPGMRKAGRGDFVFISSVETRWLSANAAPYAMSKAAMEALAFTLAKEEVAHGIRANVVAPGLVATEMGKRLVAAKLGVDIPALDAQYPFGHVCTPEDVARVVLFLVSGLAGYVTGQSIAVDGGLNRPPATAGAEE